MSPWSIQIKNETFSKSVRQSKVSGTLSSLAYIYKTVYWNASTTNKYAVNKCLQLLSSNILWIVMYNDVYSLGFSFDQGVGVLLHGGFQKNTIWHPGVTLKGQVVINWGLFQLKISQGNPVTVEMIPKIWKLVNEPWKTHIISKNTGCCNW